MKKMLEKIIAVVVVLSLSMALVACGEDREDDRVSETTRATEATQTNDASEPSVNITESYETTETTVEPTTSTTETSAPSQPEGQYTYVVYAGTQYETTLTMDINIDDYLRESEGSDLLSFKRGSLGNDLGWTTPDADQFHKHMKYDLGNGSNMVYLEEANYECRGDEMPQIYQVAYYSTTSSDWQISSDDEYCGIELVFGVHSTCYTGSNCGERCLLSRDDVIMISYLYWSATVNPVMNPLEGTPLDQCRASDGRFIAYYLP